ncbi:MAG: hypothetical protein IPH04_00435 [Saprospirales bacterium]|jgi:hypothetical protein|nr:hypothetical protein [Saprospirales bacterium]MBK6901304.1 hypothetical protein [Saprospirales bacterium]MBK7335969.1 hypothetical protein [Saprospirales bacterium]
MELSIVFKQVLENKTFIDVSLSNGKQFQARVKALAGELVVFSQVPGREFFEMYVPMHHVVSVEVRIS